MATIDTYTSPAGLDYELSRISRAVNINLDGYSFTAMVQEREPGNWCVHFGTEGLEQYGAENKTYTSMADGVCYAEDMLLKARAAKRAEREAEEAAQAAAKESAEQTIETEWAAAIRALDARGN